MIGNQAAVTSLLTSLAWEICFPALCTRKRLGAAIQIVGVADKSRPKAEFDSVKLKETKQTFVEVGVDLSGEFRIAAGAVI